MHHTRLAPAHSYVPLPKGRKDNRTVSDSTIFVVFLEHGVKFNKQICMSTTFVCEQGKLIKEDFRWNQYNKHLEQLHKQASSGCIYLWLKSTIATFSIAFTSPNFKWWMQIYLKNPGEFSIHWSFCKLWWYSVVHLNLRDTNRAREALLMAEQLTSYPLQLLWT